MTDLRPSEATVDFRKVTLQYEPAKPVVSEVSLRIAPGEIVCLVGPNGAGKSSLVRAAARLIAPAGGELFLFGRPAQAWTPRDLARRVAVALQNQPIPPLFTVEEAVAMGRAPFIGFWGSEGSTDRRVVRETLEGFELSELRERRLDEISAGELKRVVLARAFAQEPELLIIDEPTNSLDLHHQVALLRHVLTWARRGRRTVLAVLHDVNLAALLAERIVLLETGRIVAEGTPPDVLESAAFKQVYGASVVVKRFPEYPALPIVLPNPECMKG